MAAPALFVECVGLYLSDGAQMSKTIVQLSPYLNGRFVTFEKAERTFSAFSPLRPDELLATSLWSKDCVDELIEGMQTASGPHGQAPLAKRLAMVSQLIEILKHNKDNFVETLMRELGRSRNAVEEEWSYCVQIF